MPYKPNSKKYGSTNLIKHSNGCYMNANRDFDKKQRTLGIGKEYEGALMP